MVSIVESSSGALGSLVRGDIVELTAEQAADLIRAGYAVPLTPETQTATKPVPPRAERAVAVRGAKATKDAKPHAD